MKTKLWLTVWLVVAIKFLLLAILSYFLVLKPWLGAGYGVVWCGIYLGVVCPAIVVWAQRKKAENEKAEAIAKYLKGLEKANVKSGVKT